MSNNLQNVSEEETTGTLTKNTKEKSKNRFAGSIKELKNTKTLTGAALMVAITVVINTFRLVLSPTMEISFSFLAVALSGMLYGPFVGGIVGGLSDFIAYVIRPSGPFLIGFTINKIVSGVIFGLFLYKKKVIFFRIAIALLIDNIIVTLILTPIWLNILYGTELFAIARVIKCITLYPINLALMYMLCKAIWTVRIRGTTVS